MLTQKQLKIFGLMAENTFREYTFKELKQYSKEKSNSVMQNALKQFLKEELLIERKIGFQKLYLINHNNPKVLGYLAIAIDEKLPIDAKRSISLLVKEIEKYTLYYSLIIFGSYADNTSKKQSDLDVGIIIPDKKQESNIKIAVNSAKNKSLLELDAHIITNNDFLEMLKADYENLGKEIARKSLPVHNNYLFYKLISRGIRNGFKIIP